MLGKNARRGTILAAVQLEEAFKLSGGEAHLQLIDNALTVLADAKLIPLLQEAQRLQRLQL